MIGGVADEVIDSKSIGSESYVLSCMSWLLEKFVTGCFWQAKKEKREREDE